MISLSKVETNDILTTRAYNTMLALCTCYGFAVNALICYAAGDFFTMVNPIALIIGYFILAIVGCLITNASNSALVSFLGYNLVVLPVGVVLSTAISVSYASTIMYAFMGTAIITAAMLILSMVYPKTFLKLGRIAISVLLITIIADIVLTIAFRSSIAIIDYLVIAIMAVLIGYDFIKANQSAKNMKNVVVYSLELYLDIINIFVRLLSRGNSRSKK